MNLEEKNQELQEKLNKFKIIENILASKPSISKVMSKFSTIEMQDFRNFANSKFSIDSAAEKIHVMEDIEKRLREISVFKSIFEKNKVGVGGGFSAGKSSFINSFIKDKKLILAKDVNPTTAIPTYIASSQNTNSKINLHTYKESKLNLDNERFLDLNHNFFKTFMFDFKSIAPYITIETILKYRSNTLDNICFIDTPGYNASEASFEYDKASSREYLYHGDILFWLIDIKAGTMPRSDLELLEDLDLENKKVYFVLNKADSLPKSQGKEIMTEIIEVLNSEFIEYEGISAYSSSENKEFWYNKISLESFLNNINKPLNTQKDILSKIDQLFKSYDEAIKTDIDWAEHMINESKKMTLNLNEENFKREEARKILLSDLVKSNKNSVKNPKILKEMRLKLREKFDIESLKNTRQEGQELNKRIKKSVKEILNFGD